MKQNWWAQRFPRDFRAIRRFLLRTVVFVLVGGMAVGGTATGCGADSGMTSAPGVRPGAGEASDRALVDALAGRSMVVLPIALRTVDGTDHDSMAASQFAALLREVGVSARIEVGETPSALPRVPSGTPQFEVFQQELVALKSEVVARDVDADFVVQVEVLIGPLPRGGKALGGIPCFILTHDGEDAFSFRLNSYHRIVAAARLRSEDATAEARAGMVARAAGVAATALQQQIGWVRKG